MRVVVSWSGGKDSCLSFCRAISSGIEVSHFLNFVSEEGRCMSHGLDSRLIISQSHAIGIPLIQRKVTWKTYEHEFKTAMKKSRQMGVEGAVFGDIDVEEHRDWVYRVCREVDIKPLEPLWGADPEWLLTEFIDDGFEAIVVNAKADLFDEEWLGRKVDKSFLEDLRKLRNNHKIHICGELGEYHTLVTDGPIFRRRLRILDSNKVLKEGYWNYWLLDISRYAIEEKGKGGNAKRER